MEWFAEDPVPLLSVGLALFIIAGAALLRGGGGRWLAASVAGLAIALGGIALDRAVVTPREGVEQVVDQIAEALVAGNVNALVELLDADFRYGEWDRRQVHAVLTNLVQNARIEQVHIGQRDVRVARGGHTAAASGMLILHWSQRGLATERLIQPWQFSLERRAGQPWRIVEASRGRGPAQGG